MILQLRRYNGNAFTKCALDDTGQCHVNKQIEEPEFELCLAHYMDNGYQVQLKDDKGQSDELYEIYIP